MSVQTMPFASEADAVEYVAARLAPYCKSMAREPRFADGFRPDLGIRLKALPDIPICIEVKKFEGDKQIRTLSGGISQAHTYARRTGGAAFLAPFIARGSSDFHHDSRVSGGLLVAGQFSVGAVAFHPVVSTICVLVMAGQNIAHLGVNDWGDPVCRLHPNARTFLTFKHREGSNSWRALAS